VLGDLLARLAGRAAGGCFFDWDVLVLFMWMMFANELKDKFNALKNRFARDKRQRDRRRCAPNNRQLKQIKTNRRKLIWYIAEELQTKNGGTFTISKTENACFANAAYTRQGQTAIVTIKSHFQGAGQITFATYNCFAYGATA